MLRTKLDRSVRLPRNGTMIDDVSHGTNNLNIQARKNGMVGTVNRSFLNTRNNNSSSNSTDSDAPFCLLSALVTSLALFLER
jgi:hypothetical protein